MRTALQTRPLTMREIEQKISDFHLSIEPVIKAKAKIYNVTMPVIRIYPDGRIESEYRFTEDQQKLLDMCDEMIEQIRQSIFGDAQKEDWIAKTCPVIQNKTPTS